MLPTFVNLFSAFSFCNMHDISWGTKEGNLANERRRAPVNEGAMEAMKLIAHKRRRASMVMLQANAAVSPVKRSAHRMVSMEDMKTKGPGIQAIPADASLADTHAGDAPAPRFNVPGRRRKSTSPVMSKEALEKSLATRDVLKSQIEALLNADTCEEGSKVMKSVDSRMGDVYKNARQQYRRMSGAESKAGPGLIAVPSQHTNRLQPQTGGGSKGNVRKRQQRYAKQGSREDSARSIDSTRDSRRHLQPKPREAPKRSLKSSKQVESEIRKEKRKVAVMFAAFRTRFLGLWLVTNYFFVATVSQFNLMEEFATALGFVIFFIVAYKVLGSTWYILERMFKGCVLYVAVAVWSVSHALVLVPGWGFHDP